MVGKTIKPKGFEVALGAAPLSVSNATLIRVYNPAGANGVLTLATSTAGTANLVSGSANLVGTNTGWLSQYANGGLVVLTSNTDGYNQKATLNVVTNNTFMNITTTLSYSNTVGVVQSVYANVTLTGAMDKFIQKTSTDTVSGTNAPLAVPVAFIN